jgi:hypothetical protein
MNEIVDIAEMIADHFEFIQRDFHILPEDEFEACYRDYPQARYGWTFPDFGAFCVERLAKQTMHLNEEDMKDYMRAIFWMIDRHVVIQHNDPDMPALDRHRMIENELYDIAPNSLALVSQVEMNALD